MPKRNYYTRDGIPITREEWAELRANRNYTLLADDHPTDEERITTRWSGIDNRDIAALINPNASRPLIYATTHHQNGEERTYYSPTSVSALLVHQHLLLATRKKQEDNIALTAADPPLPF